MAKQVKVFYAYPHDPANVGETISAAIEKLKTDSDIRRDNVRFTPWTDNTVSGKRLVTTILEQIDRSDVFACDLTHPNPNVSFELGYAIARFKRIFASLNPGIRDAAREYKRLYFALLNMGYTEYDNHHSLAQTFLLERPWKSLDQTLLDKRHRQQMARLEHPTLMYVKPPLNSDSVIAVQEEFRHSLFGESIVVDDPHEYSSQILEWYAEKLLTADAVVVHLLSAEHVESNSHNLKASIIAGLALGFRRPTIMLAHAPYQSPIDYQRWLSVHETAEACVARTKTWLDEVGADLIHRRPRRQQIGDNTPKKMDLRSLFLGDPVAEHEADRLHEYFVETSAFYQALEDPLTILLGRRGTGKTAIMYAIRSDMKKKRGHHVTVLKPIGYETHGLIRVLEEIRERSERGFLIESLWKYLIYSEIASDVRTEILERPVYQGRTPEEESFLEYYEGNGSILTPPFSERIEVAISSLQGVGDIANAREQRLRISEGLHSSLINELRRHIGEVLARSESLTLLIDGLDEPWSPGEHVNRLADLIGGLLGVVQTIPDDFRRSSSKVEPVEATVTVLLRSDIFAFIQNLIPEQDKLPIVRVAWDDEELLLRVLEERMLYGAPRDRVAADVWANLFPADVAGVTSPKFILRTVLPRPRDLIHLTRAAVSSAINRGHERILEADLLAAREQYSQYAFNSILKEDNPSKGKLEDVLYEFASAGKVVSRIDIEARFASAGVELGDVDFYLDLLCDINFLGIEVVTGFRYSRDEEERRTLRKIAEMTAFRDGRSESFEISPAFYQVLQIE